MLSDNRAVSDTPQRRCVDSDVRQIGPVEKQRLEAGGRRRDCRRACCGGDGELSSRHDFSHWVPHPHSHSNDFPIGGQPFRAAVHSDDLVLRHSLAIELRFFWGMTLEEVAAILDLSVPSVVCQKFLNMT